MSVGERLREERLRLGFSQPAFAAIAGATKSGLVKWEKDEASPNANAMIAWADAGADPLYILTGRRAAMDPHVATQTIQADLDVIRRRLLAREGDTLFDNGIVKSEAEEIASASHQLSILFRYDTNLMTPEQRAEAAELRAIADNPSRLAAFRAADFVQDRKGRERTKASIREHFDEEDASGWYGPPTDPALTTIATLAFDYAVPIKILANLVHDLRDDTANRKKVE